MKKKSSFDVRFYFMKYIGFCCCIPNCISLIILTLILSVLVVGLFGFVFFLVESVSNSSEMRNNDFTIIRDEVVQLLQTPKVMADSLSDGLLNGMVNLTTQHHDTMGGYLRSNIKKNVPRLRVNQISYFTSNGDCSRYYSVSANAEGVGNFLRINPYDGLGDGWMYLCANYDFDGGNCTGTALSIPFNPSTSVCTKASAFEKGIYLPPYVYFCPGANCAIWIVYSAPAQHATDGFKGQSGIAFSTSVMSDFLKESTNDGSSFIINLYSGDLLASSSEEIAVTGEVFGANDMETFAAIDHPNKDVQSKSLKILNKHDGDFDNIPEGEVHRLSDSRNFIDYERINKDGIDILLVRYIAITHYYGTFIAFNVIFVVVTIVAIICACFMGCVVTCCINCPLWSLQRKMKKAENLDLDSISKTYSCLGEVNSLERKFYVLTDRLKEYKAFLPAYIKDGANDDDPDSISDSSNDESGKASSHTSGSSLGSGGGTGDLHKERMIKKAGGNLLVQEKNVTLVRFRWLVEDEFGISQRIMMEPRYLKRHGELCEIIADLLKKYKASVRYVNEKDFEVSFNMDNNVRDHINVATRFTFELISRAKRMSFGMIFSIVNGSTMSTVVGSKTQKSKVIIGKTLKLSECILDYLSQRQDKELQRNKARSTDDLEADDLSSRNSSKLYSSTYNFSILVTETIVKGLSHNHYKLTPVDIVFLPELEVNGAVQIFSLQEQQGKTDSEWMYELDHKNKLKSHELIFEVFEEIMGGSGDVNESIEQLREWQKKNEEGEENASNQKIFNLCTELSRFIETSQKSNMTGKQMMKLMIQERLAMVRTLKACTLLYCEYDDVLPNLNPSPQKEVIEKREENDEASSSSTSEEQNNTSDEEDDSIDD